MKITITHYDETVTMEVDHDDVTIEELYDLFRRIALSLGYAQGSIDEYLASK